MLVVFSLDKPLPRPVLVNLIKNEEFRISRPGCGHDRLAVRPVVPIEVGGIIEGGCHKIAAERGLSNLARSAHKDHFFVQIVKNARRKVAFFHHARTIHVFCVKAK